ncbi:MAG: hypothetical protein IPJ42_15880 [Betaproteobacteria bacterium]|nr:hypothetical protein [Betaproteobacteria bacterium]
MTYGATTYGSAPYGSGESGDRVLYWAVQPSATTNWADNATGAGYIAAGLDGTGAALPAGSFGSQEYTGAGVIDMETAASGLTPGQEYEFGYVVYDSGTVSYSNVVVSDSFRTTGGAAAAGGGKSRKPRKRRYQVEIDGEVHEVESLQEAEAVLAEAAQKATATAKLAIERAAKAKRRPVRKIVRDAEKALAVPEVAVPPSLQSYADQMIGKIRAEYQSALSAIEIAAHMAKREREIEEDDEDVLMLL